MRCDDNDRVLFFIEQDSFNRPGHLTDLRAIFKVISEAHWPWCPSEEKQRIRTILISLLIDLKRAEDDICDRTLLAVWAYGCESSVCPPHSHCTLRVTRHHTRPVVTERYNRDGGLVQSLKIRLIMGIITFSSRVSLSSSFHRVITPNKMFKRHNLSYHHPNR